VLVLIGPRAGTQVAFWSGVAFLVFLQMTAVLLSLLPIPGLDGYGMVAPSWLPRRWVRSLASLSGLGLLLLVGLLWIPELNRWFFQRVFEVLRWLGVSEFLVRLDSASSASGLEQPSLVAALINIGDHQGVTASAFAIRRTVMSEADSSIASSCWSLASPDSR